MNGKQAKRLRKFVGLRKRPADGWPIQLEEFHTLNKGKVHIAVSPYKLLYKFAKKQFSNTPKPLR